MGFGVGDRETLTVGCIVGMVVGVTDGGAVSEIVFGAVGNTDASIGDGDGLSVGDAVGPGVGVIVED